MVFYKNPLSRHPANKVCQGLVFADGILNGNGKQQMLK
jgi:hypothetical protein